MSDLDRREKDNRVAVELRMEFPRLYELAEQYERFGGSTDKLAAEADAALRELWMARTDACKINEELDQLVSYTPDFRLRTAIGRLRPRTRGLLRVGRRR